MPTNLRDPKSGQTYFQAMTQLATLMDLQGVSIANLPKIPFFENFWAKAAGNGLTPTQVVAQNYLYNDNQGDFTSMLSDIDNGQSCNADGSPRSAATAASARLAAASWGRTRCGARSTRRSTRGPRSVPAPITACSGPSPSASAPAST